VPKLRNPALEAPRLEFGDFVKAIDDFINNSFFRRGVLKESIKTPSPEGGLIIEIVDFLRTDYPEE